MIWFTIGWCVKFASYWVRRCLGFKPTTHDLVNIRAICHNAKKTVGARLVVTCRHPKHYSNLLHNETRAIIDAERSGDAIWPVNIRVFVPTGCEDVTIYGEVPCLRKEAELKAASVHAGWNNYTLFLKDKPND